MKTIELLDKLKTKPVFRIQDIERIAYCNQNYAKQILNRLKKRKLIKQITRNRYTTKDNIFVVASNIVHPSYISFWSASSFLGYTEQITSTIQVATTRKSKPISFEGYKIRFIPIKNYFFGYKKMPTNEGDIFIAEDEKLVIDSLLRPEELGNIDEIGNIFENAKISKEKITGYLKKIDNLSLTKRAGFLLERKKSIDISKEFYLDNNYVLLNPSSKRWKSISTKWRIKA